MKTLILCEGKHDTIFIKLFLRKLGSDEDTISFFDLEENLKKGAIRRNESEKLRSFLYRSSPYKILVKSEGGVKKVIDIFTHLVNHLLDNVDKTILMVDLDNKGLDSLLSKINKGITSRYNQKIELKIDTSENTHLLASKVLVQRRIGKNLNKWGCFFIVAFKSSLEKECPSIAVRNLTKREIESKISQFIDENKNMLSPFSSVLNPNKDLKI